MSLAPIVLFTFNRIDHTKRTIEALKKNVLAEESELFIFSDGARNDREQVIVNELRTYLKTIDGFKYVEIVESEKNQGLAKSVISGVTKIIDKYKKVIVLEDDLVTSKYFLTYMNDALRLFEGRSDIWSISGYGPNINIPYNYADDIYIIKRGGSWGWATWNDRWELVDWKVRDYENFIKDKNSKNEFNKSGGDLSYMLEDQMKGRINSWAIRWVYSQYRNNMWTVYPIKSFVKNIGNDLSGTHSSITDKYNVNISDCIININNNIKVNEYICKAFKQFYDLKFTGYIAVIIKKIGLYKQCRKIRNKILRIKR